MPKKCKYEKSLRGLVEANQQFMRWLDAEMVKPSSPERGGRIARALNALGIAVDQVRYFTLGIDYRRDKQATFRNPFSAREHAAFLRGVADAIEGKIVPLPTLERNIAPKLNRALRSAEKTTRDMNKAFGLDPASPTTDER